MNIQITKVLHKIILLTVLSICSVSSIYAQGPTAPEAASFEPVDATDMVNLVTGDMSYVMPLLNIPSPEGGYPITLAYHAGIAMDQESSWVGLGWNINAGAINRSVIGYPDDWKQERFTNFVHDAGGTTTINNLSVSSGFSDGLYSVAVNVSWGTNRSVHGEVSSYFTPGIGLQFDGSKSWNGNNYSNTISSSIGLNYSFGNGSFSASFKIGYGRTKIDEKENSLGYSKYLSKNGAVEAQGSLDNYSSSSSTFSVAPASDSFNLNINFFNVVVINYSYAKLRYWLSQRRSFDVVGSLYPNHLDAMLSNSIRPLADDFDSYETFNDVNSEETLVDNNFSFISFDKYSVNAQGLSGNFAPSLNEFGSMYYKQGVINDGDYFDDDISYSYNKYNFNKSLENQNLNFYFNNVYSSHLSMTTSNQWKPINNSYQSSSDLLQAINIDNFYLNTSVNDNGNIKNNYNQSKKRITQGKYIEVFTNEQIKNTNSLYFNDVYIDRNLANPNGIGAYIITSLDGKKYYYTLPVYQKEKFDRTSKINRDSELAFFEEQSLTPYATHWLLTAIIGPDYVDSNSNNEIDNSDYGYWVKFDYGKWSDGYVWRTPAIDYEKSQSSKKYSWGIKEIYYLDKIQTRTHSAYFIKSKKLDGQSNTLIRIGNSRQNPKVYEEYGLGYNPKNDIFSDSDGNLRFGSTYDSYTNNVITGDCNIWSVNFLITNKYFVKAYNHSLLKLDKIVLIKNDLIPSGFNKNTNNAISKKVSELYITERVETDAPRGCDDFDSGEKIIHDETYYGEYYENVIDLNDYKLFENALNDNSLEVIDFAYDYNLAYNTPNSLDLNKGKLTLSTLLNKGKKGISLIPPFKFEYYRGSRYNKLNMDDWGYYNKVISNSLKSIINPTGAKTSILYEEDDYYQTAIQSSREYNEGLQLSFYEYNSKLRIKVEKSTNNSVIDNTNFIDFFTPGISTKVDIWACLKHEFNDYPNGCKSRDGNIDIDKKYVDVISVSESEVIFETSLDYTYGDKLHGLKWLYDTTFSYEMDDLQSDKKRGKCPELPNGCKKQSAYALNYEIKTNKVLFDQKGGGLRVKEISVINEDNLVYKKNYYYNEEGFNRNKIDVNYRSSGITTYKPSKYFQFIPYQSELPGPYVLYNTVTVEDEQTSSIYKYKTIKPVLYENNNLELGNILKIDVIKEISIVNSTSGNFDIEVDRRIYNVQDKLSSIGALLSKKEYNKKGMLLSSLKNDYIEVNKNSQGVFKESFNHYKKEISNSKNLINVDVNVSTKTRFPIVLESTTTTQGGYTQTTFYSEYDFNTGQLLETRTYASDGTTIKTKKVPAYTKYSQMGSKVDDITNKNMLSQQAASYTYLVDPITNEQKVINASISTWNNNWIYRNYDGTEPVASTEVSVWRKFKNYIWDGDVDSVDGAYLGFNKNNDDAFDWGVGIETQSNVKWKTVSTTTRYDHYSMPLETKDINNNFASTKMCDQQSKILSVANAKYTEQYYSGAEYKVPNTNYFDGEIKATGQVAVSDAHTGNYIVSVNAGVNAFEVVIPENLERTGVREKFKVSVWVRKGMENNAKIRVGGSVIDFNTDETQTAGSWSLLNGYITIPINQTMVSLEAVGGNLDLDDFRLYPTVSSMTSYVYNEWDELWYIIGTNGLASKFEYDAAGRLKKTYTEIVDDGTTVTGGFKLVSKNRYNYKKQ